MLRTPSLTVDKTDHDYLQTRLRSLSAGFDVDVSGAAGLTVDALKDWLEAVASCARLVELTIDRGAQA